MPKQQEPKTKPASKADLLLEVALEAKYFRNALSGVPLVLIPNHPTKKTPVPLQHDNSDFTAWLTWRCHKKHGFLASTALINTVLRYLAGLAQYDESIQLWDNVKKEILPAPQIVQANSDEPLRPPEPPIAIAATGPPVSISTRAAA